MALVSQISLQHRIPRTCYLRALGVILVLLPLVLSSCGENSVSERAFQEISKAEECKGLVLRTDRYDYQLGDDLTFWVENQTDRDLWFPDDNFGVQGYIYDSVDRHWRQVDLGNEVIGPIPRMVKPGHSGTTPPGWLSTEWFQETGKIRLVVRGSTQPDSSKPDSVIYIAFKDVVIQDRR